MMVFASCCSRSWIWWFLRRYAVKHSKAAIVCGICIRFLPASWCAIDLLPDARSVPGLELYRIMTYQEKPHSPLRVDSFYIRFRTRKAHKIWQPRFERIPCAALQAAPWFILLSSPAALWRWWQISTQKASGISSGIFFMERNLVVCQVGLSENVVYPEKPNG